MSALTDAFGTGSLLGGEFAKSAREKLLPSSGSDDLNNMTESDLPRHLHRLYMYGTNSDMAPFEMPRVLPPELVGVAIEEAFVEYADLCTATCAWKKWETRYAAPRSLQRAARVLSRRGSAQAGYCAEGRVVPSGVLLMSLGMAWTHVTALAVGFLASFASSKI